MSRAMPVARRIAARSITAIPVAAIRIAALCIAPICIAPICAGTVMVAVAWADQLVPDMAPFVGGLPPAGTTSISTPSDTASPASPMSGRTTGPRCTIAVITENVGTSDTYLSRATFPAPDAPAGTAPVCPPAAAEIATRQALDACKLRAASREDCVFADTNHMFDISADAVDSSALDSKCFSFASKFIAIACRPGSQQDNCNVACGATAAAATAAARSRCHANHEGDCAWLNAAPVQAP